MSEKNGTYWAGGSARSGSGTAGRARRRVYAPPYCSIRSRTLRQYPAISVRTGWRVSRSTCASLLGRNTKTRSADTRWCSAAARRGPLSRRKASRISRRNLLRRTAWNRLWETAYPARRTGCSEASRRYMHWRRVPPARNPWANTRSKLPRPRSVPSRFTYRRSSLIVSFLRPRARRRDRTLRPFLVAIRSRNPCVLRRFLLCG
jgi:hypothetical protein